MSSAPPPHGSGRKNIQKHHVWALKLRHGGGKSRVTGIDDPYEVPQHAEITLDTVAHTLEENALLILDYLIHKGFVPIQAEQRVNEPLRASRCEPLAVKEHQQS